MGNICFNIDQTRIPLRHAQTDTDTSISFSDLYSDTDAMNPVYKIVLVGESQTGMTSYCTFYETHKIDDTYRPTGDKIAFSSHQISIHLDKQELLADDLVSRVSMDEFDSKRTPTPQDRFYKHVSKMVLSFQLWDGCKADPSVYFDEVDAIVMMYDVTRKETLNQLNVWMSMMQAMIPNFTEIPLSVIGNKVDMMKSRQVQYKEGNSLSERFEAQFYFETSCKTGQNVEVSLNRLVQRVHELKFGKD